MSFSVLFFTNTNAQDTIKYITPGASTFRTPAGVTPVTIRLWGGGGGGGGSTDNNSGGGGGGGGGFRVQTVPVTSGALYNLTVGAGGAAGTDQTNISGDGQNGLTSSIIIGSNTFSAGGGQGGLRSEIGGAGGFGGGGASGDGGNGANRGTNGGGGGSSAGPGGTGLGVNGNNGTGTGVGGAAVVGGGAGGNGGNGANGLPGAFPGGGGGGGERSGGTFRTGGAGASGQIQIIYNCPTYNVSNVSPARACSSSSSLVTLSGPLLPIGTYTVSYTVSGANNASGTQTMVVTTAGTGTFTIPGGQLLNGGSSTVTITNLFSAAGPAGSTVGCTTAFSVGFQPEGTLLTGDGTINLNSGSASQTFCEFSPLNSDIVYAIGGTATGATASGLPAGLTTSFNSGLFTITGTPTQSGVFNFTVTTTGVPGSCDNPFLTGTITVHAAPQGFLTGSTPICVSGNPNLIWTSTAGMGPFIVEYTDGTSTFIRNNVVSEVGFPHQNAITANTTFTVTKVTSAQSCERTTGFTTPGFFTIPVYQLPDYTTTSADQVCSGAPFTFTAVPTIPGSTLAWSRPVVAGISNPAGSGNGLSLTENLISTDPINSVTVTYQLTFNNNGCTRQFSYDVDVFPQPVGPTLNAKTPNTATVCAGQTVSASFNPGSGGLGCTDDFRVIIDGGTPQTYTAGDIVGGSATTSIVIQGRRANSCLSGCNATPYVILASWDVVPNPTSPTLLSRTPSIAEVCVGRPLSAQFNAGTGGFGCSDEFIWKIDGVEQGAYTPGSNISSATAGVVTIEGRRANCTAGTCVASDYVQLASWTVVPNPVAPTLIAKTPNLPQICIGNPISITTNPGSGGVNCSDAYVLQRNGALVQSYTPGSTFSPELNGTYVIKAIRSNCNIQAGCTSSDTVILASWIVANNPLQPQIIGGTKIPNTDVVCSGTGVQVEFTAQGGPVGCGNTLQSSIDNGVTWQVYPNTPTFIPAPASGTVIIRAARGFNCVALGCTPTAFTEVVWTVVSQPVAPTLAVKTPNTAAICFGNTVSATINPGSGGVNCTDEYRAIIDGSIVPYTPGAQIGATATSTIVIQVRRAGCTSLSGCTETNWTEVASWNVNANPTVSPLSTTAQNVCVGATVPALSITATAGSGDISGYQWYRNSTASNTGGTLIPSANAASYTPPNNAPGTNYYYVVVTNSNGCTVTSNVSGAITIRNCFGINVTGALINIDCEAQPVWYNATGNISGGNSLNGGNLGIYEVNSTLLALRGGEIRIFKETDADVCGAKLFYRVYRQGDAPGTFTDIDLDGLVENCPFPTGGACSGSDQKWNKLDYNIELAFRPAGNYIVEFYFAAVGKHLSSGDCTELVIDDNNGNYYSKAFSVVNNPAYGSVGEFATSAYIETCTDNSFYNTTGFCANLIGVQPLNGTNLGSFVEGSTNLTLLGGELKSFNNPGTRICGVNMRYRVYPQGSPSGEFLTVSLPQFATCFNGTFTNGGGACSGNDKKWQSSLAGVNLVDDRGPGNYVVEVYYEILANTSADAEPCNNTISVNNGGSYYSGTFTIVPLTLTYANTPFCSSDAAAKPPTLTAAAGFTGGTYAASPAGPPPGLTINASTGNITPSTSTPGTYTVTYETPSVNGCTYTTTASVTITPQPTPVISYAGTPYCKTVTSAAVTLSGINTGGGTYTASPAVLNIDPATGEIDPSESNAGTYTVTYTIPLQNGCGQVVTTTTVTITALPTATISYPEICSNQTSGVNVTLTGTGAFSGGKFTSSTLGTALNEDNGRIIPTAPLAGSTSTSHKVFYTIPATGGCPAVVVETNPDVVITRRQDVQNFLYDNSPFCSTKDTAILRISGINIGYGTTGVFTAADGLNINATTGLVNVAASTPGTYAVTYTIPADGGCALSINPYPNAITITQIPSATLSYSTDFYCSNTTGSFSPIFTNEIGAVSGGTFSSDPVGLTMTNAGVITPSSSTPTIAPNPPYTITYTIPALAGCPAVPVIKQITITPAPTGSFSYNGGIALCSSDSDPKPVTYGVTTGNFLGGTFSAPPGVIINSTTGAITPLGSPVGTHTITYTTPAAAGCAPLNFISQVTITPLPVITSFIYPGTPFCSNIGGTLMPLLNATGPAGQFSIDPLTGLQINATNGELNFNSVNPGNYNITYTIPASAGCSTVTATTSVAVTKLPSGSISYGVDPVCPNATEAPLVSRLGDPGGIFSAPAQVNINPTTGTINPSASIAGGPYTITLTYPAADGCPAVPITAAITIRDVIAPVLTVPDAITVSCPADTIGLNTGIATAVDNCTPVPQIKVTYTDAISAVSCPNRFTVTRTWRAEDAYGNVSTQVQIINVNDAIKPVLIINNLTVNTPDDIPVEGTGISASDNCSLPANITIELVDEIYPNIATDKAGFCPTLVRRFYRAIDQCGNISDTITQNITISDVSECGLCQSNNLNFVANLGGAPDSLWLSPSAVRSTRLCCDATSQGNNRCVSFNVFLDKNAVGLVFDIEVGAVPPGALFYQVDCGGETKVGEPICLAGGRFYTISFCKPGNNTNVYSIQSIRGAAVGSDIATRIDCNRELTVSGLQPSTIIWQDITSTDNRYAAFLSPSTGSATTTFSPDATAPSQIRYRVCGTIAGAIGGCTQGLVDCDTVTVNVVPEITAVINVPPNLCPNDSRSVSVNTTPGGTYTYRFLNSSGTEVQAASAANTFHPQSPGNYTVEIVEIISGLPCSEKTFSFTAVFDETPPVITAPADLSLQCNAPVNASEISIWLSQATATDNAAPSNPAVSYNYAAVTQACNGTQQIIFTAQDNCGNQSQVPRTITYIDNLPPNITGPLTLSAPCNLPPVYSDYAAFKDAGGSAVDQCAPESVLADSFEHMGDQIINSNPACPTSDYQVARTYRVTDECGNIRDFVQTITIRSTVAPVPPASPAPQVVACISDAVAPTNIPEVLNSCLQPIVPTLSVTTVLPCDGGQFRYTYTYQDCSSGLSAIWEKIYSVPKDETAPTITEPAAVTICRDPSGSYTIPVMSAVDNCGSLLTNSYTITGTTTRSGSGENASGTFELGTSTITWRSADICGNFAERTTTVTIIDVPTAAISGSIVSCPGQIVEIPITLTGIGTISGTIMPGNIPFSGAAGEIIVSVTSPATTTNYTINAVSIGGCPGTASGSGFTITIPEGTPGTWNPTQCIAAGTADWYDCRNWAGGIIPTASINVVIPASAACNPVIDINSPLSGNMPAVTNSITIEGRTLQMLAGSTLNVHGNWTNNVGLAGFDAGDGTVAFRGSGDQTITTTGATEEFNNLVVYKTGGRLILGDQVDVSGTLTLTSGIVDARTAKLNVTNCNANAIIDGSNASYVYGELTRCTNSTAVYTFPVGDPNRPGSGYRPAYVQPEGSGPSTYTARYYYGTVPQQGFENVIGPELIGIVDNEQWVITGGGSGCSNASIGFDYIYNGTNWTSEGPENPCGGTIQCSNVGVVYKPGPDWTFTDLPAQQGTGFDASRPEYRFYNSIGTIWSKYQNFCNTTNYFSFGHGYSNILPIRLLNFSGILHNSQAWLQWTVADNEEVRTFDVEHSTDGERFTKVGQVNKGNNPAYQFLHNGLVPGNNYYRLQMNGKDGTRLTSKVVVVSFGRPITYIVSLNPTLVKEMTQLSVVSAKAQVVQIRIMDMRGRLIRTERAPLKPGNNTIPVYMTGISNAMYMLHVYTEDGAQATYKILKE